MSQILVVIILVIVGFGSLFAGAGIIPGLQKDKKIAGIPLNVLGFVIGFALVLWATIWTFSLITPKPHINSKYNIPETTEWYFVDPDQCKNAMVAGVAYTPEKFAERYECKIGKTDARPDLVMLDCRQMLNNVFYMIKGDAECGKMYLEMHESYKRFAEESNKKAE